MTIETTVDCDVTLRFITQWVEETNSWHYYLSPENPGWAPGVEISLEQMQALRLPTQNPD